MLNGFIQPDRDDIGARKRLLRTLRLYAVFCVAIMITATWYHAVEEAKSETENLVTPAEGIDLHVPYGTVMVIENETRFITGDVIVEGTLYVNDSYLVMTSISEDVVNSITVKPWGSLYLNWSEVLTGFSDRKYEAFLYGKVMFCNSTLRNLNGEEVTGVKTGGIQVYSDLVTIDNSTVRDSEGGPAVRVYKCSPVIKNSRIENCTQGISIELDNTGSNNRPSAVIQVAQTTYDTGDTISFDGTGSSDSDGVVRFYKWDFGNGNVSSVEEPQVQYAKAGLYFVSLTVVDNEGAQDTADCLLTINNQDPIADAGPDLEAYVNEPLRLDGSRSSDEDGFIVNYTWTIGQDTLYGVDPVVTFTDTQNNPKTVQLTVTDDDGGTDDDTLSVNVITKATIDWPSYLLDDTNNAAVDEVPPATWDVKWSKQVGGGQKGLIGLVENDGRLFCGVDYNPGLGTGYDNWIVAIDPSSGYKLDDFGLDHPMIHAANSPDDASDSVVFQTEEGHIYKRVASDLTDGLPTATFEGDEPFETPILYFVLTIDVGGQPTPTPMIGYISSIESTTDQYHVCIKKYGDLTDYWNYYVDVDDLASLSSSAVVYNAAADDVSYIFSYPVDLSENEWKIRSIHLIDKQFNWDTATGELVGKPATPILSNGNIYVGTDEGYVYAFDADSYSATGTRDATWSFSTSGPISCAPVAYSGTNDVLLVFTESGDIYGLDASDGSLDWVVHLGHGIPVTPVLIGETCLVIDEDGGATLLDVSEGDYRRVVWYGSLGYGPVSPPIFANGNIYVRDSSGNITCIDPDIQSFHGSESSPYDGPDEIQGPDLTINASDIRLEMSNPREDQLFEVFVRTLNRGQTASGSFVAELFERVDEVDTLLDSVNVGSIGGEDFSTITFDSISFDSAGIHELKVKLDANGDVTEDFEDNNVAFKNITVNSGQFAPALTNITIDDCDLGLFVSHASVCFDNVTLIENTKDVSALYGSGVELKNSNISNPIAYGRTPLPIEADTNSQVNIRNDLTLEVWIPDPLDQDSFADIEIFDVDGVLQIDGNTNGVGVLGPVLMTRATVMSSGVKWFDPYTVHIRPTEQGHSQFLVLTDHPKSYLVYSGGDSDLDGISDSQELSNNIVSTYAVAHSRDPSQVVDDLKSGNAKAVRSNTTGVVIHSNILRSWVSSGCFRVLVEARQMEGYVPATMTLEIGLSHLGIEDAVETSVHALSNDTKYHWFISKEVDAPSNQLNVSLKVTATNDGVLYPTS